MEEIFHETFSSLKARIRDRKLVKNTNYNEFHHDLHQFPTNYIDNEIISDSTQKLQKIKYFRQKYKEHFLKISQIKINIEEIIHHHYQSSIYLCQQHEHYARKQLVAQNAIAERRLRELVYEIIGEYGKSLIRAKRRQLNLRLSNRIDQVVTVHEYRWKLFLHRFIFEALSSLDDTLFIQQLNQSLNFFSILNPFQHADEYSYISSSISRITNQVDSSSRDESSKVNDTVICWVAKFDTLNDGVSQLKKNKFEQQNQSDQRPRPTTVSRLYRGTSDEFSSQTQGSTSSIPYFVAETTHEMKELISYLSESLFPSHSQGTKRSSSQKQNQRPSSSSTSRITSKSNLSRINTAIPDLNSLGPYQLVSNHYIEWLKPCSYHTIAPNVLSGHFKSFPSTTLNQFDQFTRQFVTQYMTTTYSQNIYFCLEERFLSGIAAADLLPSNSNSSSGSTITKSNNDLRIFQALKYLQVKLL